MMVGACVASCEARERLSCCGAGLPHGLRPATSWRRAARAPHRDAQGVMAWSQRRRPASGLAQVITIAPRLARRLRPQRVGGFDCAQCAANDTIELSAPATEAPGELGHASDRCWAEHQHGIEPAERERIRHGVTDFQRTSDVGYIIEIAIWIGIREADGGGN